jgi:MFS transporter, OFA family, oxalate/formate antiporter
MDAPLRSLDFRGQALSIAAAVLVMASIGTLYTWSIFVAPIEAAFGQSRGAVSLVFSVATVAFTAGMFAGPWLLPRRTPQTIALLSCLSAAVGLVLAATGDSAWLLVLGFGVLFGVANGLAYGSSLQVVQHAAPRRTGLFTGIAVASYMLGSVVGSPMLNAVLEVGGYRLAFLLLAAYFVAAGVLTFFVLQRSHIDICVTHQGTGPLPGRAPFGAMAILWLVFFLSSLVGVMILAHAAPLAASLPGGARHLALAAMLVALGNGAGRLAGGWLSDQLPPRALLCGAPALVGAALAAVLAAPRLNVLLGALCVTGVGYGCIAGCLPALLTRFYGRRSSTSLYGRLFTAWGLAGLLGPYLGGMLFDLRGDYRMATMAAAAAAFAAALIALAYTPAAAPLDGD